MRERLAALMARFDALSVRERVLVLCALLGLIVFLWDALLMAPLNRRHQLRAGQFAAQSNEISQINRAIEEAVRQGVSDPNEPLRKAIENTRAEVQAVDRQMHELTTDLIDPREMSKVLEQVLTSNGNLKLVALENLEAAPLTVGGGQTTQDENTPQIYRHGIVIQLNGTYLDTLRYLRALEQLHWRFFWDKVELSVETWPAARVTLVVYTLSLQEGLLGV